MINVLMSLLRASLTTRKNAKLKTGHAFVQNTVSRIDIKISVYIFPTSGGKKEGFFGNKTLNLQKCYQNFSQTNPILPKAKAHF